MQLKGVAILLCIANAAPLVMGEALVSLIKDIPNPPMVDIAKVAVEGVGYVCAILPDDEASLCGAASGIASSVKSRYESFTSEGGSFYESVTSEGGSFFEFATSKGGSLISDVETWALGSDSTSTSTTISQTCDSDCSSCASAIATVSACAQAYKSFSFTSWDADLAALCFCYDWGESGPKWVGDDFDEPFSACPAWASTADPEDYESFSASVGFCASISESVNRYATMVASALVGTTTMTSSSEASSSSSAVASSTRTVVSSTLSSSRSSSIQTTTSSPAPTAAPTATPSTSSAVNNAAPTTTSASGDSTASDNSASLGKGENNHMAAIFAFAILCLAF